MGNNNVKQVVYILTNESMPGYIKIGFTHGEVVDRIKQLDRTGTPLPFEIHYASIVENAEKEERWLHSIFSDRRVRDNREFFKMNPELATLALKRVGIREEKTDLILTKEQEKEVDEVKERRSRFRFANYGIPIGSKLTFTRDKNIIAEVVENDKIKIDDRISSLSSFAQELLEYQRKPQGTLYFEFEDEILDDRRRRMDDEEN
ncbi:MAG: GIY-YIG nuclease family protein [Bacteroidales bacterium]|jgi:rhamnose utilization protein RhaD (predicted bifunctional aldolase and dehydrogenase)|nr:GIY-YIG nuclease family protein [Bacteroidales bacterium]